MSQDQQQALSVENPVLHFTEAGAPREAPGTYEHFDQLRAAAPIYKSDIADFWMVTRADHIREAMGNPTIFSSESITQLDPNPSFRWVPENLDPPLHTEWRRRLAAHFAPAAIAEMRESIQTIGINYIDEIASRGECDYVQDFALKFPTSVLLDVLALPQSDTAQFLAWEDATVRAPDWTDQESIGRVVGEMLEYMGEVIEERRKNPGQDVISQAISWEIDGKPTTKDDLKSLFLLLFMAGLDTVATQLSFATLHFARNPEDQSRVRRDPDVVPTAVEEMVRLYSLVAPGRKVTQDTDFHGVQFKKGQMVWMPLWSANRDPDLVPDPLRVDLDRTNNPHLGFGWGVHRCLGVHLAREEMRLAVREWHQRIPAYSLKDGAKVEQRLSANISIDSLPLEWKTT